MGWINLYHSNIYWLTGMFHGSLGITYRTRQPVTEVIANAFMPTLWLAFRWLYLGGHPGLRWGLFCHERGKWQD
ncbi:hypothetical protein P4S72_06965 [Vibrio sp. PP-XX7]